MKSNYVMALCAAVVANLSTIPVEAATKEQKAQAMIASLTPEHFYQTSTLKDSEFDKFATITTVNGYQDKAGILKNVNRDVFFRALVDKKTGTATFQIYATINYGGDWKFFQTVDYVSGGEAYHAELTKIDSGVGYCSRYGCEKNETFGFNVSEQYLRTMTAGYDHSQPRQWKLRFNAKDGSEWQESFIGSEIVGILQAVDSYRADHGLNPTPSPTL